jgi:hypothetical protein
MYNTVQYIFEEYHYTGIKAKAVCYVCIYSGSEVYMHFHE